MRKMIDMAREGCKNAYAPLLRISSGGLLF